MYLKTIEQQAYNAYREMIEEKKPLTAFNLKNKIPGIPETPFMLVEIFKEHNKQMAALVNKQYAPNILRQYVTALRILEEFLQWKYTVKDLDIQS